MDQPAPRLRQADRSLAVPDATLDQLVDADHTARLIWDYVCQLDLSPILSQIKAVQGVPGRNSTDPRILLALWMYALVDGVGSARDLEDLCRKHTVYRWLAGGVSLNYHTLCSFRTTNAKVVDSFFTAHVSALLHQGLIDLSCVAQDGMRTRASAGSGSFKREATLEECKKVVREQITALSKQPDESADAAKRRQIAAQKRHASERLDRIKAAKQAAGELAEKQAERVRLHPKEAQQRNSANKPPRASTTDPEARQMKMPDGGVRPGYNVQLATTVETEIIVGVGVTNVGADGGQLGPMVDQIHTRYAQHPKKMTVDGGFASNADIETAHAAKVEVYMPVKDEQKQLKEGKDPYAAKAGDKEGMKAFRARMGTEKGKEIYQKRFRTAEGVNARMRQRGLYRVTVRGTDKVLGLMTWHAWAYNVMTTVRLLDKKEQEWSWAEILRAEPKK